MIRILDVNEIKNGEIFSRMSPKANVEDIVADIIADVRKNGDEALYRYCEKFDHASLSSLEVSEQEYEEAMAKVDDDFIRIPHRRSALRYHEYRGFQVADFLAKRRIRCIVQRGRGIIQNQNIGVSHQGARNR